MKKKLDDGQNHLTGPEYEFIRNLLKDVLDYKVRNESEKKSQLHFIHWRNKTDLRNIIDKMGRRMDMFDPNYLHTCW